MKKIAFKSASYLTSTWDANNLPQFNLPEIAVLGRSNVGKSSLLNDLFHTKNLVKTSSTPGKTQSVNFFCVDNRLICADLPGYGYAKIPQLKKQWADLLKSYVERESIALFLLLLDIRHQPSVEDCQMYKWLKHNEMQFIIVFTKNDKLSPFNAQKQSQDILHFLNASESCVHYSVPKKQGRLELIKLIQEGLEWD